MMLDARLGVWGELAAGASRGRGTIRVEQGQVELDRCRLMGEHRVAGKSEPDGGDLDPVAGGR